MAGVRIVETVTPPRPARRPHIGRVAVDPLAPGESEIRQKTMRAAVVKFNRGVAAEPVNRPAVKINADIAQSRGLALHDRLAQTRRRLRSIPCRHPCPPTNASPQKRNRKGRLGSQTENQPENAVV